MAFTMRALADPGPGYVTWQTGEPDYAGIYAPSPILAGTAVIASGPAFYYQNQGKLGLDYAPVGLWLFDGDLTDDSGNGFDLTGAPLAYTDEATEWQRGAVTTGAASWTRVHEAALTITGAVTVEVVGSFQSVATGNVVATYIAGGELESANCLYQVSFDSTGAMAMYWESGAGVDRVVVSPAGVIPRGLPVHLAWTRSADAAADVNFYVNGVNVGSGSALAATGGSLSTLYVGGASGGNYLPRLCVLSSLKIIAAELSAAQIEAEFNRTLGQRAPFWPRIV